ncbi:ABC transporter permease [Brevibacterium renqingii]|uniref:ABC transporter permease n=1 Tax=Brevibacterium renqingii TaxID=2776916 RepID=UPI001ADEF872
MLRFIVVRLTQLIPTLFGLSVLLFAWVRALPGDPARALLGDRATPEAIERINDTYGFDEPLIQQYGMYLSALFHGDFGESIKKHEPVLSAFFDKLPATVELSVVALLFAVIVGIPLGYLAGKRSGTNVDGGIVTLSLLGSVVPVFFLALLLKYVFSIELEIFDSVGRQDARLDAAHTTGFYIFDGIINGQFAAAFDAFKHLVLPGLALGTIPLAVVVRQTRGAVAEVINEDYVRTARAKGLRSTTITVRHVMRNALLPVVTTLGLQLGLLFSGAVLTETVFALDGVGQYLYQAIRDRDYPVLQGFILLIALIYALITLIVDLSYGLIDPRVRES